MAKKPAPSSLLSSPLISRKGEAIPAVAAPAPPPPEPPPVFVAPPSSSVSPVPKGTVGTIAVTVRLDPARYERLKLRGVRHRQSNQDMLVAALDAYLDANQ